MTTPPQQIALTLEKRISVLDKLVLSEEVDFNCLDALIKSIEPSVLHSLYEEIILE